MQERIFDLEQTMRRNKAREKFLAFAGLRITLEDGLALKDCMVKVGGHIRLDGSGYLCLTFLVDTDGDDALNERVGRVFRGLDEMALRPLLGDSFIYLIEIGSELEHSWFVNEVYFYFKDMRGQRRRLLEDRLIPALQQTMPLAFEDLQWWGAPDEEDEDVQEKKVASFMDYVRQVFGVRGAS